MKSWFECIVVLISSISSICTAAPVPTNEMSIGRWSVRLDKKTHKSEFLYRHKSILKDVYVQALCDTVLLKSSEYKSYQIECTDWKDQVGNGKKYVINYEEHGKPTLRQIFYFYPACDFFLTEAVIVSEKGAMSNYLAPIKTDRVSPFLPNGNNRMLFIPFDNDAWVRYASKRLNSDNTSFEVTAIYNGENRKGLIIGSVEHDIWKTGIKMSSNSSNWIKDLECYSGITDKQTRDILPHGKVYGKEVKSAKIMIGFFDDWRQGMEKFGEINAIISPPRSWNKGTPFGWNSWGGMKDKLNFKGAVDVAEFIKKSLQVKGFENNGTAIIDLDSFWDNLTLDELKTFVKSCKAFNQVPGIYWGPFTDWGRNPEAIVVNGLPYKYKDVYLYANGKPQELDGAYALDPTHPAVKARIDHFIDFFRDLGIEYIKLDFVTHGSLEADHHFDKSITTGIEAYNTGMQYVMDKCGPDMFMAQSIAPSFPAKYGHSKRIGCDAWGSINDVEYTLNGLSFGWWLNNIYPYNDADHLVLFGHSEGENRARITSGVITGLYFLGDNLSLKGSCIGSNVAREKVLKFVTNEEINKIAKIGRSFKPVEGYSLSKEDGAESEFMLKTRDILYLAVFNYTDLGIHKKIRWERLNVTKKNVASIIELWDNKQVLFSEQSLMCNIPPKDVRLYKVLLK